MATLKTKSNYGDVEIKLTQDDIDKPRVALKISGDTYYAPISTTQDSSPQAALKLGGTNYYISSANSVEECFAKITFTNGVITATSVTNNNLSRQIRVTKSLFGSQAQVATLEAGATEWTNVTANTVSSTISLLLANPGESAIAKISAPDANKTIDLEIYVLLDKDGNVLDVSLQYSAST